MPWIFRPNSSVVWSIHPSGAIVVLWIMSFTLLSTAATTSHLHLLPSLLHPWWVISGSTSFLLEQDQIGNLWIRESFLGLYRMLPILCLTCHSISATLESWDLSFGIDRPIDRCRCHLQASYMFQMSVYHQSALICDSSSLWYSCVPSSCSMIDIR